MIFGEGISKIADVKGQKYITSIPRIYKYFGIVGMAIFSILAINNFIKLRKNGWIAWVIVFCISFASEILFHSLLFVYAPYIIVKEEK